MMKRKLSRTIAAVLTCAMAFTLLAVPASAATSEDDAKKITGVISTTATATAGADEVYVIYTKAQYASEFASKAKDDEKWDDAAWAAAIDDACKEGAATAYTDKVPDGAVVGLYDAVYDRTIWLSAENAKALSSGPAAAVINWRTGVITANGEKIYTLNYAGNEDVSVETHEIISVFAAAGVVATVYLASNPQLWGQAADAVQSLLNQITGKTAAAA